MIEGASERERKWENQRRKEPLGRRKEKEILGISREGHWAVQPSDVCPNQSGAPGHWVASLVSIFCSPKDEVGKDVFPASVYLRHRDNTWFGLHSTVNHTEKKAWRQTKPP